MRALLFLAIAVAVVFTATYATPLFFELALLRFHVSPWVCLVFADIPGCFLLASMGFPKTAVGVYLSSTGLEVTFINSGIIRMHTIVWLSNVIPALIVICMIARVVFIMSDVTERKAA
jgi:hypothetical protein